MKHISKTPRDHCLSVSDRGLSLLSFPFGVNDAGNNAGCPFSQKLPLMHQSCPLVSHHSQLSHFPGIALGMNIVQTGTEVYW